MYLPASAVSYPGWTQAEILRGLRGLGDGVETATKAVQTGTAVATPVLTGALAANAAATAAATGSAATILGMSPALAVPVIGAAMVGVTVAVVGLIKLAQGCGQTCIVTSQWANQAEDLLKQNLNAYLALPTPRPKSAQNTAISNFHVIWEKLQQMCGQPGTGDAGVRCIQDRREGACKWRDNSGQCWNWFIGYLNPIANDPHVADDSISAQASSAWSAVTGSGGNLGSPLPLLLGAGLIIAAAVWL